MPTPQRLPIVNSDDGQWGDILNQYLKKEHYDDGTDNAVNGGHQKITIRAGTATANTAPLKFTTGTNLTTPETGAMEFSSNVLSFTPNSNRYSVLLSTIPDATDITLGTSTGTKIGTSTTQKLGFFNATPIVQPSGDIVTALANLGLVASGTVTPTGAVILAPTSSTTNVIQPTGDFKPLIVKGNASQTATLQEWQNSSGTMLAQIGSDGKLSINNSSLGSNALDVYTASSGTTATFQTNGAASGNTIIGATLGNTVSGNVYGFKASGTTNSGDLFITAQQNGNGSSVFNAMTTSSGDAKSTYEINGGQSWGVGLDNSDGDSFKISSGGNLGTNDFFKISTTGGIYLNSNTTTYTAAAESGLYKNGTFTINYVNGVAPYYLEDASTYEFQQSASGFGMGLGSYFHPTFKNKNGVAANLSPYYAFGSGPTMQADGATITQSLSIGFGDVTTYNVANSGVLTQTQHDSFRSGITVSTGATVTTKSALHVVDATVTGTLTNSIGVDIDAQTGGTNIYGIRSALAASGTSRYHLYLSGTAPSYFAGNVGIASSAAPGTVEKLRVNAPATIDNTANVIFTASASGARALVVQGQNGPSVPAFEVQNGSGTSLFSVLGSAVSIADGGTLSSGSTNGLKIGTATTQKLGFFNSTPIVQPANTVAINDLLVNIGLRASGGTSNFTTTVAPPAGTTGAGTAPIKLTSGSLMTTPEAGALEFLTDTLYFTQTTSTTRKKVAAYDDSSGATGDIYYRDSSGYFVRLGIGSGNQVLGVSGGVPAWAQAIFATATKTGASYTITSTDTVILADASSNGVTITLPAASSFTGYRFYIKRKDASANTVTIGRTGSDTIDGATSQTLNAQYTSATVVSDGSNWYII